MQKELGAGYLAKCEIPRRQVLTGGNSPDLRAPGGGVDIQKTIRLGYGAVCD